MDTGVLWVRMRAMGKGHSRPGMIALLLMVALLSPALGLSLFPGTNASPLALAADTTVTPTSAGARTPRPAISVSNADQVKPLWQLDGPHASGVAWSPDSKTLAVATAQGLWLVVAEDTTGNS